jgi:hypothetical protein
MAAIRRLPILECLLFVIGHPSNDLRGRCTFFHCTALTDHGQASVAPTFRSAFVRCHRVLTFSSVPADLKVGATAGGRQPVPLEEPQGRSAGPALPTTIPAVLTFALSNPKVNGQSLIRSGAWGGAVEPQSGDLPQPRPSAWVRRANPFQRVSPEGAALRRRWPNARQGRGISLPDRSRAIQARTWRYRIAAP